MQMISKTSVVRVLLTTALGWVSATVLIACGQKGPLVMPGTPAASSAASSPSAGTGK